jgi:hypothetical protein
VIRADHAALYRPAAWLAVVLGVAMSTLGCARELDESTPEGACGLFLEALARSADDPTALEDAYRLLDEATRRRLADRANSMTGGAREHAPWEMIVQGRSVPRFMPRRGNGLRARTAGDTATVVVTGDRAGERAEVPMRREEDGWRVVIAVPDVRSSAVEGAGVDTVGVDTVGVDTVGVDTAP